MTREEIIDKLRDIMKEAATEDIDWDSVAEDTAIETMGFDSLSILDLIYDIQQEFGVEFEAEKLTSVRTVGELTDFLTEVTA